MIIIARWHASDHDLVAARLRALGFTVDADGRICLEGGVIEIVAAPRGELAADEQLAIAEEPRPVVAAVHPNGITRLLAVGVASIDVEETARGLGRPVREAAPDRALGARAVLVDDLPIVLLEPTTEGRLAAALARFGPSPVAVYLAAPGARPMAAGSAADGPFGPSTLLAGTPAWGPHLLVCDVRSESSSTIGP